MKTSIKVLHWTPRTICILAIIFISLFALDSFGTDLTIWKQIAEFLIHLIPTYVLIIILIIAWKRELIGGIIYILIGLGFSPFIFIHNYKMNHSVSMSLNVILFICMPFVIVGVLFIMSYYKRKKESFNNKGK